MTSLTKKVMFVAAMLVTRSLSAADGVLIVEKTTSGANSQTNQIQLEKDRMPAETAGVVFGKVPGLRSKTCHLDNSGVYVEAEGIRTWPL